MEIATPGRHVVGFIGAGKMGQPMIAHLVRAGFEVVAADAAEANLAAAVALGAARAADIGACVSAADVVVTSLPDDAALAAVGDAIAGAARRGLVHADTSTVSPQASARLAARHREAGVSYVRSTVSGNPVVARAAGLTVMASGPRAAYDFVLPLLASFGKTHFYLGEGEQARVIKLVINLLVAGTAGLLAEALVLGEKGELDWAQMLDILGGSAAGSPMVNYKVPPLKSRDYASTFSGRQMIKDLDLILDEGARTGVPLALTAQVRQMYAAVAAQGDGDLDYIATVRLVERLAGMADG
ncbi:MAG: NAD(P)-dependent oxidoreductase [Burkholderiales bacterium]|nr:NAD(P)-dependent oxidoreductase [Burkholderiales bacterium]